jgi:hypothetical protein
MPHAKGHDHDYAASLSSLEVIVKSGRLQRRNVVIGVDANAIVGTQCADDDRNVVGQWGHGQRNERGQVFTSWLHTLGLCAANTMFKKRPDLQWTHQLWSTGLRRQIDFVLIEKRRRNGLVDSSADAELSGSSDHRFVRVVLRMNGAAKLHRAKIKNS